MNEEKQEQLPVFNEQTPLIKAEIPALRTPITIGPRGVQLNSFDELWRFASAVHKSCFCPKGFNGPADVMIAIQSGMEIGLTPMQALQSIAVINGRPGIFGDAALAIVRASGLCESYSQEMFGTGDTLYAEVSSKRVGQTRALVTQFSVDDAKKAGLWGKKGYQGQDTPWVTYPERMLLFRARGFNLRDNFGDVLKGFKTTEELADYPDYSRDPRVQAELHYDRRRDSETTQTSERASVRDEAVTTNVDRGNPEVVRRPRGRPRKAVEVATPAGNEAVHSTETIKATEERAVTNETPTINNASQIAEKQTIPMVEENPVPVGNPTAISLRAALETSGHTEARLLAVLGEWGFASNTTQSLDEVDQQTLGMVSKRWAQVESHL